MNNQQSGPTFQVTLPKGEVLFYHKWGGQYFPVGGGFSVSQFPKGTEIQEIDSIPPRFTEGVCYFEDGPKFRCICNTNDNWNGWALPFLLASEVKKFIEHYANETHLCGTTLMVDVSDCSENEFEKIEMSVVQGKQVYDLGVLGWCWDFEVN